MTLQSAKPGRKRVSAAYVEGKVGRDTNVNNASEIPNNIITPTLYPTSAELADNYYGAAAGGEINHDLNAEFPIVCGSGYKQAQ